MVIRRTKRYNFITSSLSARALNVVTQLLKGSHDGHDMIALHFDHAVFDGAPGAASSAQLLAEQPKCDCIKSYALNERYALSATALGLQADAHHTVGWRQALHLTGAQGS